MDICIPTINQFDNLRKAIELWRMDDCVEDIFVIDNSCGACPKFSDFPNVKVIVPDAPMPIAEAWNRFIRMAYEQHRSIIISNDDCFPRPNCATEMQCAINDDVDCDVSIFFGCVVENENKIDNNYSMFSVRYDHYQHIGAFDEAFTPAYYEDCDWDYRRRLLHMLSLTVMDAQYEHIGSATAKSYKEESIEKATAFNKKMLRNASYYAAKWGGAPGREIYIDQFNGKR